MAQIVNIYNEVTSFLAEENEMEFLLYHFAKNEKYGMDYVDYFRKMKKYKIFDNSFYELRKEIDYDDYFNFAEMLDVDEIILPDKLWDGEWTRQKVKETLNEYYDYIKSRGWKVAAVVQGSSLDDIKHSFEAFIQDERIDVIMIPRKVLHESKWSSIGVKSYSEARIEVWKHLTSVYKGLYNTEFENNDKELKQKPIHFLGANSLWEILYVKHDENVRSIDTKWFSKMLLNRKWEDWIEQDGWPFVEDLYNKLKQKWQTIKQILNYDEKYGVV